MFPSRAAGSGLMGGDMDWDGISSNTGPPAVSQGHAALMAVMAVLLVLSLAGNGYGVYHWHNVHKA